MGRSNYDIFWSTVPQGTGDLPISELVLGLEAVCKNINDKPKEPTNVGNYKLRRAGSNTQSSCEGGTDASFVPFSTNFLVSYMQVHNQWPIVDSKLSASFLQTEQVSLYKRPYLPLKKECRNRAMDLEKNDSKVDQMRGAQMGLLVVAAFIAVIIGMIISMMDGCLTLHESGCCALSQKRFECFTSWKGKKDCIDLTLKCINAAFLIWAVVVSSQTKGFFSKLAADICFTVDLNTLVSDFAA